jgi:two-component system, NtrC family, sensor kinase
MILSLRSHILLFVLVAAVTPITIGLFAFRQEPSIQEANPSPDEQVALLAAKLITRELNDGLRLVSLGMEFFDLAKLGPDEVQGALRMLYKQDDDLDVVVLMDSENHPVVAPVFLAEDQVQGDKELTRHLPLNQEEVDRFLKNLPVDAARESGRAFSDVYVDTKRNVALLAGAVVVPRGDDQPPWLLGFEFALRKIQQAVSTGVADPDQVMYVFDGGGRLVAHPDGRRFLNRELVAGNPLVAMYLKGKRMGTTQWTEDKNQLMTGAFWRIEFMEWGVAVQRKLLPKQASPGTIPGGFGWVVGLGVVLVLVLGWVLARRVLKVQEEIRSLKEVAEKKTLEFDRVQASALESRKLNAIGDLGAGVAHEFNNPIGGILGLTQLLLRKKKGDDPDVQFLQRIEIEAKRCKEITDNLLRFSEQQVTEYREPQHIGKVMDLAVDLIRRKLEGQGIHIERNYAAHVPRIWGNEIQLQRVFLNLLQNAETAMPNGGMLTLSTGVEGEWVVARVNDTGKGIPKENIERVFEPFFSTKDNWKGAGLGLSVVYQIVREHEGQIELQSEEGKGTIVTLRFPPEEKTKLKAMTAPVPLV